MLSIILFCFINGVTCHARLIDPPARTTAWRFGFGTPANYNDHETNCGGFSRQWAKNGGKCGQCGDAWDLKMPRPGESGGQYGRGVTVRSYTPGQLLEVRVDVTANHRGHFQFALCPENRDSEACFLRNPLRFEDGSEKFFIRHVTGTHRVRLRLPALVTCDTCVLQWRYVAGNNWGTCPDGSGKVGCGPQEEFRACADIRITRAAQSGGGWPSLGGGGWPSLSGGGSAESRPSRPTTSTTTRRPPTPWWSWWSWRPWSRRMNTGSRNKTEHSNSYLLSSLTHNKMSFNLTGADSSKTKSSLDMKTTLTMYTELCKIVAKLIQEKINSIFDSLFSSIRN